MTISSSTRKAGPYTGNGVTTVFSFSFKVFKAADVEVVRTDLAGTESILVLGTDYTVALNSNQNSNPGGTITATTAPASGIKITITSAIAYTQLTDLTNQGGFYPAVINDALDRATIQIQQLNEQVGRAAKLPISSTLDPDALVNDLLRLADSADNIDTVAGSITNVNAVAGNATNINTVAGSIVNVNTVAGSIANVNAVAGNATNINAVAGNATNINAVNANKTNIDAVAGNATNINAVNANKANVDAVAGNNANITAVAGNATNINAVNANKANIDLVAGDKTNIDTVATNIASVNTAAANVVDIHNFADVYQGAKATAPTTRNDGSALHTGDLYFDTVLNSMRVYGAGGWTAAGSSVNGTTARFRYIATAGQSTFTGVDSNGNTLGYDAGFVDIYRNGVRLDQADYTATSGTSIVLTSAASVGDEINIIAFGTFTLANLNAGQIAATDGSGGSLFTTVAGFITRLMSSAGAALVGFIQAGTGAVQRTLQDKGREFVSIKDFGAVGDGVADDTAAIQAAINASIAVYIPAGTYRTTSTIKFRNNLRLFGDGNNSIISYAGAAATWALQAPDNQGSYNMRFRDFMVRGNASSTDKYLLDCRYVRYSYFENIFLMGGMKAMRITSSWGVTFNSCTFQCGYSGKPAGSHGIEFPFDAAETWNIANLANFNDCEITFNDVAVYCQSPGRNVVFRGCGVEGNNYGFLFSGQGVSYNFVIDGCYFEANTSDPVNFNFLSRLDINVVICNNFVQIDSNSVSGFVNVSNPGGGGSSITMENNMYDQEGSTAPANLYALYTPSGHGATFIKYEHNSFTANNSTFAAIKHWNKNTIDFRYFSSNVPVNLDYLVNPVTTNTFTSQTNNPLRVFVQNGTARICGSVVDSANTYGGDLNVASLPSTLQPSAAPTTLFANYTNVNLGPNTARAMTNGANIRVAFNGTYPGSPVEITGSWPIGSGAYISN